VRRGLVILGGLALALVTTVLVAAPAAPAIARVRTVRSVDQVVTVHIRDNVFAPANLNVAAGTTVRWVNDGRNTHNVTPDSGHAYGSGNLKPGKSYVHTFEGPGAFAYYCTLHGTPTKGQHAQLAVGDEIAATPITPVGAGNHPVPKFAASGRTIRVPADAETIQAGVDRAKPGDLVLVSPGVYREAVTVGTDGVVVRGVDRNTTVLDGQFKRANGVFVVGADGVALENLTARNYTENGFFWNGVLGYRGSYLTAYRNGDYGIYAYDSQYGQFDHSYASGSADSGFYIGQCNPCHAVITHVVSEYNELGYSGTNASRDLTIVNSVWSHNRTGIVPNSLDSEELPPQGMATIAGNLVDDNGNPDAATPANLEFDPVFGGGIVLIGGVADVVRKNRVVGSAKIGIAIAPNPGIQDNAYLSTDNSVTDNVVQDSGLADLAVLLPTADDRNCFSGNTAATTAPTDLEQLKPCGGAPGSGDLNAGALDIGKFLDTSANPPGQSYKVTPVPRKQRNLAKATTATARPAGAPAKVDLARIAVPVSAG
jgi:plastocyanin